MFASIRYLLLALYCVLATSLHTCDAFTVPVARTRHLSRDSLQFQDDASLTASITKESSDTSRSRTFGISGKEELGIIPNRVLASIIYTLPLLDTFQAFAQPLIVRLQGLKGVSSLLGRITYLYSSIPMLPFGLFMGSYMLVIKQHRLVPFTFPYFVKYNVMQALILTMVQYMTSLIYFRFLGFHPLDEAPLNEMIMNTVLMGALITTFTCAVRAAQGRLPEVPVVSEAVCMHIGDIPLNYPEASRRNAHLGLS